MMLEFQWQTRLMYLNIESETFFICLVLWPSAFSFIIVTVQERKILNVHTHSNGKEM